MYNISFRYSINNHQKETLYIFNTNAITKNLKIFYPGQPIVHIEHGIGRYVGLITIEIKGIKGEYFIISYLNEDKLYVPVASMYLINSYISSREANAPLHKLGGNNTWIQLRKKVAKKVYDIAVELLDIYSHRLEKPGFSFKYNTKKYEHFSKSFPFDITPDQKQAINAVLHDMCQPFSMDRLICGDVGFGKTEVAIRAAFLAVENSKQVAVLVPTTLLAQQHLDNFRSRFLNWSIQIEMLSRFRSKKEQQKILHEVSTGQVNIIIGTHKLLQGNIHWKDLGLLIIDEEHRFGVYHKERIKKMYVNIDILTLTATPIPRTLNMSMIGMRDLSIISTPPACRLEVKTFICEYNSLIIRKAIMREILRGGQVYYVYNNVNTIKQFAKKLEKLIPEARIVIGHGQMHEHRLEKVIHDFYHQRFNVLVCTTIIESGIDIASANTIIIDRADRFGLAQLHQLRGRVQRSHYQAYAYFLIPNFKSINADAKKRLLAITSLEQLDAGFSLAIHDLEIRGAGDLLGENQSGQINAIGFKLYTQLLENAIYSIKNGFQTSLHDLMDIQVEIKLNMPAFLPDNFIQNINVRLSFYQRIASAKNKLELDELKIELINCFGVLPEEAYTLIKHAMFRQYAKKLGIKYIECNKNGGYITFNDNNCINPTCFVQLLKNQSKIYCFDGKTKFKFILNLSNQKYRIDFIQNLLNFFLKNILNLSV